MSEAVVVREGEGHTVTWGPAGTIRILGGAESTGGAFSVVEAVEAPGSAAPLHVHRGEAEAFYVVEGAIELTCGGQTLTARAGDFVHTPAGVPHRYAVVGDRPARVLLLFSRPGFEQFFAEASAAQERIPEVLAKYDLEVLEPFGH
ncbi:MAG TPA: cupin domain-containing protein [Gaiellaceae bacterium]|jgi:quercetin dioxygenase-like cupin family protein|nr:cupin domain-containing protein [Gaiellaceae bacterium]